MKEKFKTVLFILLFCMLWMPFIQQYTRWLPELKLDGAFVESSLPPLTNESIKSFEYQNQFEKYQNEHFGFRPLMVKIKNSIDYWLFSELSNADNVEGKNGLIFSVGSIARTLGLDYNGKEVNQNRIDRIRFMNDGLKKHGCKVITTIAPSKEMIYPEYLPLSHLNLKKGNFDYLDIVTGLRKSGVDVLDFCHFFRKMKDTCAVYPLYTRTGFHWSAYSSSFAQDTLLGYIKARFPEPIPEYKRVGAEWTKTPRDSDADFEKSLNLLCSLNQPAYLYPKLEMIPGTLKRPRPKVIIIGDSFFWQIKDHKNLLHIFSEDSKFWYYFAQTSFPIGDLAGVPLKDIDVMKELETADFVILFASIGTLKEFPFGVTDYYYDHIAKETELISGISSYLKMNNNMSQKISGETLDKTILEEALKICRDKEVVKIKALNNKYLSSEGGRILADKEKPSTWETFTLIPLGNNKYAIASHENKFLSSEIYSKAEITSTRININEWEVFTMVSLDNNNVAFKACNGKYISADEKSHLLFAKAISIGKEEIFQLNPSNK
jgi:hypothetical protein